jgi:hypothetical protein
MEVTSFLAGLKPAILVKKKKYIKGVLSAEKSTPFSRLEKDYPYIEFTHLNSVLFFQDDFAREWFEANGCICFYSPVLDKWIQHFKQDVLGLILGYPPKAVESFVSKLGVNRPTPGDRVSINYYGIHFVCEPQDVPECIDWLKLYRPAPKHLVTSMSITVSNSHDKSIVNI